MAGALLGDAAVGAVFGELLKAVIHVAQKDIMFKSELKKLESTLESIAPNVYEIHNFNRDLELPKPATEKLIKKLEAAKKLVHKCSRVKWWYFVVKFYYAGKILKLDESIVRSITVDLHVAACRDIKESLLGIRGLSGNDRTGGFNQIRIKDPCSVPDPPGNTIGFDVPLQELKRELFEDGAKVIVVSAPPGSGKTTLVKKLCQDNEVKGRFGKNIFFVTFTQTPDVDVIVKRLFQHMVNFVPEFQSHEDAMNDLERLLKQRGTDAILLVLDDVWSGSESLLRRFKFQLPDYKILVTSRFKLPQFGCSYHLKPLDDETARDLFCYFAIARDRSSYIPDENLIKKILKTCRGSPLVLTVVGGMLCGEPPAVWRTKAKEWAEPEGASIVHSDADMLACLQSSLNALPHDLNECYMDLASFPEDQRIPVNALIDMWIESYESCQEDIVISKLHALSSRNLVNLVATRKTFNDDEDSYNDHFVMQHDLLRELIIHMSKLETIEQRKRLILDVRDNSFPKLKQHPVNAHLLSITTDERFKSSWDHIEGPETEVLILNIHSRKYALPNFIEKMAKLKVLVVTNYGFYPAELTNFPLVSSLFNLRRIRLERISVPFSDMSTIRLKNLQKISLVMCNVGEIFRSPTFKISDAFPNLSEIDIDYCSDLVILPDDICNILSLKKLSITNCHKLSKLPEEINKLMNLEKLRLASCTDLSSLPESLCRLSNLEFLDISDCIDISELPMQVSELRNLRTICMRGCFDCEIPRSVTRLENLEVVKCDEETARHWEYFKQCMRNLRVEVIKEDINLHWLNSGRF